MIRILPEGYETAKPSDVKFRRSLKSPVATFQKTGTLTLNVTAFSFLIWAQGEKYLPVIIAYNKDLKKIAIQRAAADGKFPETVRLTRTGASKNLGVISIKWFVRHWSLPVTNRRFPVTYDAASETMFIDLAARLTP